MSFFPQHTRLQAPKISSLQPKLFCFEIFNRGTLPFTFSIRQQDSYIVCMADTGTVDIERRITVGVDWAKVPAGTSSSRLWVDMQDQTVEIIIPLNPIDTMVLRSFKGFVASSGYVAMEAANYQQSYSTDKLQWKTIDNLGRTSSAVLVKPSVFIFDTIYPDDSLPRISLLQYRYRQGCRKCLFISYTKF